MAAKSIMHFVVDCSSTMGLEVSKDAPAGSTVSKLTLAKSAMMTYCCQRTFDSKTVEFAVSSYGDKITDNDMANADQEGYDGINFLARMDKVKQDSLQRIWRMEVSPPGVEADTISALMATTDALMKAKQNYKYNRSLVLVTDGEKEIAGHKEDMEQLETLISCLNRGNPDKKVTPIPLYIILMGKVTDSSSTCKRENGKLLRSLAEGTNGGYIEADTVGSFLWILSEGTGLGTTPQKSKVNLTLSPHCPGIPCVTWAKVSEKKMPSLSKKLVKEDHAEMDVDLQMPHASSSSSSSSVRDIQVSLEPVKRDTTYKRPSDTGPTAEASEKITDGYKYGQYYVPVSDADKEAMKLEGEAGIKLIGYMKAKEVPRHHFMGSTSVVQGNDTLVESIRAIAALSMALRNMGCVGLARKVVKEGQDPCHVMLMPPTQDDGTLLMQHIPCSDDYRRYPFAPLPSLRSNEKQRQMDAMTCLVDSMVGIPECVTDTAVSPVNPSYLRVFTAITEDFGVLNRGSLADIGDVFSVPLRDKRKAMDAAEDLQSIFPLKKHIMEAKGAAKEPKVLFADRMANIVVSEDAMRAAAASIAKVAAKDPSAEAAKNGNDEGAGESKAGSSSSSSSSSSAAMEAGPADSRFYILKTLTEQNEVEVLKALEGVFEEAKKALSSSDEELAFSLLQRMHNALTKVEPPCPQQYKDFYNQLMKSEITVPFAPSVQRFFRFFDKLSDLDIESISA